MPHTLNAFYDFTTSPASFDFFTFAIIADLHRERHGFDNMIIHILPGPKDGFRDDNRFDSKHIRQMVLRNVVLAIPHLFESCAGIVWRRDFDSVPDNIAGSSPLSIFPPYYSWQNHFSCYMGTALNTALFLEQSIVNRVTAPLEYQNLARDYLATFGKDKKIVTITLRNNDDAPERNANFEQWAEFCSYLKGIGYLPIFAHETSKSFTPPKCLQPFESSPLASVNLLFRTALYEQAYLNLFINNGPENCAKYSKARSITFKMITETNPSTSTNWYKAIHGIDKGDQFPYYPKRHKTVWEDDTFDTLKTEFEKMVELIEEHPNEMEQLHGFASDAQEEWFINSVFRHISKVMHYMVSIDEVKVLAKIKRIMPHTDLKQLFEKQYNDQSGKIINMINEVSDRAGIDFSI